MSFFAEIRRRKVFQVAAVYAVVAWLLVQVVATVETPLNLPSWFSAAVIVLLAIGFPIALILAWAFDATPQGIVAATPAPADSPRAKPVSNKLGVLMQGLVLIAVAFLVINQLIGAPGGTAASNAARSSGTGGGASAPVQRFRTVLGTFDPTADGVLDTDIAVSPDGRGLAYVVTSNGGSQLYYRSLDQFDARPLPGTDGAFRPFFSPDGEWVGFYSDQSDQQLKKVSVRGGAVVALADAPLASGADWSRDGTIVYVTRDSLETESNARSLYRIPADGGEPQRLLAADQAHGYGTPHVLPGGEAVFLVVRPGAGGGGRADEARIDVYSFESGESRTIIEGGFAPKYVRSGHVVFYRGGGLWAVPFDSDRLVTTGREVPVVNGVQADLLRGYVPYGVTDAGLLVYVAGEGVGADVATDIGLARSLVWVDRAGNEQDALGEPRRQILPALSPDGQRVALAVNVDNRGWDIWVTDLSNGVSNRLTFETGDELSPIWSPDGRRVVFSGGQRGIQWIAADGTGRAEILNAETGTTGLMSSRPLPVALLADGSAVVVEGNRLRVIPSDGGPISAPLLETTSPEFFASLSPDGNWLAYESNETGRFEIYVRPFPNVDGGKWQVSLDGGQTPRWAADGSEIFYRTEGAVMAVPVRTTPVFAREMPVTLFEGNYNNGVRPDYDVSPDGSRFLMLPYAATRLGSAAAAGQVYLSVVYNWFEELQRVAPVG